MVTSDNKGEIGDLIININQLYIVKSSKYSRLTGKCTVHQRARFKYIFFAFTLFFTKICMQPRVKGCLYSAVFLSAPL